MLRQAYLQAPACARGHPEGLLKPQQPLLGAAWVDSFDRHMNSGRSTLLQAFAYGSSESFEGNCLLQSAPVRLLRLQLSE
jgi:hypothetical protein